jgi:hypothetical protein
MTGARRSSEGKATTKNTKGTLTMNLRKLVLAALAALAVLVIAPAAASAQLEFVPGSFEMERSNDAAGRPADVRTKFEFVNQNGNPSGAPRQISVELPAGLIGDPHATPKCTIAQAQNWQCPTETAIGRIALKVGFPGVEGVSEFESFLFNVEPPNGVAASFAFNVLINGRIDAVVTPEGGYRLRMNTSAITELAVPVGADITVWGIPAELNGPGPFQDQSTGHMWGGPRDTKKIALTRNPTRCSGAPEEVSVTAVSWQEPQRQIRQATTLPSLQGCETLPFDPQVEVRPDNTAPGAPAGYEVRLELPQTDEPGTPATSHLKDVSLTLPEGVTISPSVANGLVACTDAQLAPDSAVPHACPEAAKVGAVSIISPLLDEAVEGGVYVGQPLPGDRYRLFLAATGQGVIVKLRGSVKPDPVTGQLTATFLDNPQLPFTTLTVRLKGGPRAVLANPTECGTKSTSAELVPWSGQSPVVATDSFSIPCPGIEVFRPTLDAGTLNPVAGDYSPFVARFSRSDADQMLGKVGVELPPGLLAKVRGVPLCADAQAAAGACGAGSRIGTVTAAAGPGESPYYLQGPVFLTGPYRGAPYGLAIVVPAKAGPFDLGTVVVRQALAIDPVDAHITATLGESRVYETDGSLVRTVPGAIPPVVGGVPVRLRTVDVAMDRPGFTLNPTSCAERRIVGDIVSLSGARAQPSVRFQVGECADLGFKPKLSLRLKGKTNRSAHPALTATLKARKGDANIGKAVVTLPKTQFLEQGHIRTICTRVQYAADNCPKGAIYGQATAWTPLLDEPLRGPVYLRSSNNELPDLVADLNGQIEIDLAGRIDSVNSRMRTTFWAVPDAPVSKFVLRMQGGKKGLLVNNTELCKAKPRAKSAFTGHNGKRSVSSPLVKIGCKK